MRAWAVKDTKAGCFGLSDISIDEETAEARAASLNWSWRTRTRFKAIQIEITEVAINKDRAIKEDGNG